MDKYFKYKDYCGSCEINHDTGKLYGKILFINDLVTFEGITFDEAKKEFEKTQGVR